MKIPSLFISAYMLLVPSVVHAGESKWVACANNIPVHQENALGLGDRTRACVQSMRSQTPPSYQCRWSGDEEGLLVAADQCAKSVGSWSELLLQNPHSFISNDAERDEALSLLATAKAFIQELKATREARVELEILAAAYAACTTTNEGFRTDDISWLRCEGGIPTGIADASGQAEWRVRFLGMSKD